MEDVPPKYLNSPETPIFTKGRTLYGIPVARQGFQAAGHAVLVEGYMDLIACSSGRLQQTVATLGTAITPEAIRTLRRYTGNWCWLMTAIWQGWARRSGRAALRRGGLRGQDRRLAGGQRSGHCDKRGGFAPLSATAQ